MTVALASATLVARLLAFQAAATANAKIEGIQPASTSEQVARLGQELTPIGEERAGNADGSIPEWTVPTVFHPPASRTATVILANSDHVVI